ncbi:hypothetical protein D3C74_52880 [compost metagenome]
MVILAILLILTIWLIYGLIGILAIKWIGRLIYKKELSNAKVQFIASVVLLLIIIGFSLNYRTINMFLLVIVSLVLLVRSYSEMKKDL